MIIQIRGTSGSGKTTVMRRVMDALAPWTPVLIPGRKKPLYYTSDTPEYGLVAVLGHYEATCGGCDNIGAAPTVFSVFGTVRDTIGPVPVLMEGLLLSEDVKWTTKMAEGDGETRVVFLTTDVERCVQQIKGRRAEAGNEKPLNEENTRGRVEVIERARLKLLAVPGVEAVRASSNQASGIILKWLRTRSEAV